jgi:hypothetical protein
MASSTSSVTRAESGQANYDSAEKGGIIEGSSNVAEEKKEGATVLPGSKDLKTKDTTTFKKHWWLSAPREPFESFDKAPVMPLSSANFFSKITFLWIQPMLTTGYQRTLVPTDLWDIPEDMRSKGLADKLLHNFQQRREKIDAWNKAIDDGSYQPSVYKKAWWSIRKKDGKKKVGMAKALSDTVCFLFFFLSSLTHFERSHSFSGNSGSLGSSKSSPTASPSPPLSSLAPSSLSVPTPTTPTAAYPATLAHLSAWESGWHLACGGCRSSRRSVCTLSSGILPV